VAFVLAMRNIIHQWLHNSDAPTKVAEFEPRAQPARALQ